MIAGFAYCWLYCRSDKQTIGKINKMNKFEQSIMLPNTENIVNTVNVDKCG